MCKQVQNYSSELRYDATPETKEAFMKCNVLPKFSLIFPSTNKSAFAILVKFL